GTVIGPGGRTIRNIVDRSGCSNVEMIDQEHGTFEISATDPEALNAATDILKSLVEEPEAGLTYRGVKVASVEKFGLFVEFLPEQQGLCHVSELGGELSSFSAGDTVDVKLLEVNDGKFRLSRKAVLTDDNGGVEPEEPPKPPPPPPLVEGDILRDCEVKSVLAFGAFVELGDGRGQGLVHVSQLALERVADPSDVVSIGDRVDVQVMAPRKDGKVALSRKAVLANGAS
ncbi:hypothetical protein WJX73_010058, partial [Symbiochloris irregularis]